MASIEIGNYIISALYFVFCVALILTIIRKRNNQKMYSLCCFRKEGEDILYLIVKYRLEKYGWKCEKYPKAIKIYKTEDNYLYYDLKTLHLLVVSGIDLNMVITDDFKMKSIRENLK